MSGRKKYTRAQRYLRRAIVSSLLAFIFLCSIPIYLQFFSPSQRLRRELSAYKLSLDRGHPRPDFVPHLTSNSIPYLLEWIQTKDYPTSWKQTLARRVRPLSDSFASKLMEWDSSLYRHYPPALAVVGFDFLGSQASAALPSLRELALRSDAYDEATRAITPIGPNAFPIAVEFAQHPQPRIRRTGAHILGALRVNPDESSAILLKLIDDPDEGVREEAYRALAEFPSANIESILLPRLASDDPEIFFNVAYSLHSGSTNALLHLLSVAADTTNRPVRIAVFTALAFRDQLQRIESLQEPKDSIYRRKRSMFNSTALIMGTRVLNALESAEYDNIRSNILSTGLPQAGKTLGPPKGPLTTSTLPANNL